MFEAWRESVAKARACLLVLHGSPGELRPVTRAHLLELVALAYREPPFRIPFVLEAIGVEVSRAAGAPALFSPCPGAELPAESLSLLHAGLGLGIAQRMFRGGGKSPAVIADRVDRCLEEITARALPEYVPIAVESMGLVVRSFFPSQLRAALDRLGVRDANAAGFAAHGVGRALYFSPLRFLPRPEAGWSALAQCRELGDRGLAIEAQKGVLFAQTFVTLYRPTATAGFLERHGDEIAELQAWIPGFTAALLMRALTVPRDPGPDRFLAHRPAPALAEAWRRLVAEPGRAWLAALRSEASPPLRELDQ